jgi:PAS domain S-box-containing protein
MGKVEVSIQKNKLHKEDYWLKKTLEVSQILMFKGDPQSIINLALEPLLSIFNVAVAFLYLDQTDIYRSFNPTYITAGIDLYLENLAYNVSEHKNNQYSGKDAVSFKNGQLQKILDVDHSPFANHESIYLFPLSDKKWESGFLGFISTDPEVKFTGVQKTAAQQLAYLFALYSKNLKKDSEHQENQTQNIHLTTNSAIKWLVDPSTYKIIEANEAACEFYGYDFNSEPGYYIHQISMRPKRDIKRSLSLILNEKTHTFKSRHKIANNQIKEVEVYSGSINYNGKEYIYNIIHDITEKKIIEDKLKKERYILREFVQYTPASVALFDGNFNYTLVSQQWIEDFNLQSQDIIGKNLFDLMSNLPHLWEKNYQNALNGLVERCEKDYFIQPDGSKKYLRWEMYPLYNYDNEVNGILMFSEILKNDRYSSYVHENHKANLATKLEIIEKERKRLASEIQEGLGQLLSATHFNLELIEDNSKSHDIEVYSRHLKKLVETTIEEITKISQNLHPSTLSDFGLVTTLDALCEKISKSNDVTITFSTYQLDNNINEKTVVTVYRLCYDSLQLFANSRDFKSISLQIFKRSEKIIIQFQNEISYQKKFNPDLFLKKYESDLLTIRERAELYNGHVVIDLNSKNSTELIIELPIEFFNT